MITIHFGKRQEPTIFCFHLRNISHLLVHSDEVSSVKNTKGQCRIFMTKQVSQNIKGFMKDYDLLVGCFERTCCLIKRLPNEEHDKKI